MSAVATTSLTFRERAAASLVRAAMQLSSPAALKAMQPLRAVDDSRGWLTLFSSARHLNFQTDVADISQDDVRAQGTVFACETLISSDIGKLAIKLVERDADGIWSETSSPAFSPVLRKPNPYQTRQQFIEAWVDSKLSQGNTYILKERDQRKVVIGLHVLDTLRCQPLVAESGDVFYRLHSDLLAKVGEDNVIVPASEIIHDRFNCLFHPLVGISPLFACGLAATHALKIQKHGAIFWANSGRPSGILTAPGDISDDTAKRAKEYFEQNFSGENAGRVAVLADGLKYEPMTAKADESQLVEQLKLSAEQVAAVFHVPAHMVGAAPVPPNNNVQALSLQYYSQCLQTLIEAIEACLDDGLGLSMVPGRTLGTELDLDGLLRMDTATLTASLKEQVGAGIVAPNEARRRLNLPPVEGGSSPLCQMQNYSLAALARRDAKPDPFAPDASSGKGQLGYRTKGAASVDDIQDLVRAEVMKAMAALPKPDIAAEVAKAIAATPPQVDSITVTDQLGRMVEARLPAQLEKALEGVRPKWVAEAALLVPAGRDGLPGRPGTSVDPEDVHDMVRRAIAQIPPPKDGTDGWGPENMDITLDRDGRTLFLRFTGGGRSTVKSVKLNGLPVYTGIYAFGKAYAEGDLCTYGGSVWRAQRDTTEAPKGPHDHWKLIVKRGADAAETDRRDHE